MLNRHLDFSRMHALNLASAHLVCLDGIDAYQTTFWGNMAASSPIALR